MNQEARKLGDQVRAALDAGWTVEANAALGRLVALAHREPVGEELTEGYVQPVPDKCDRITWRGRYYGLPITSATPTSASEPAAPSGEARCAYCDGTGDVHGLDGEWRGVCHCQAGDRLRATLPSGEPAPEAELLSPSQQKFLLSSPEAIDLLMRYEDDRYTQACSQLEPDEIGKWPTAKWQTYYERGRSLMVEDLELWSDDLRECFGFPVAQEHPAPHHLMIGDVVRQCAYPDRGQYAITGMHGVNNCWVTVAHPYGPFRAHELERVPAEDRLAGSANGATELIAKFKAAQLPAAQAEAVQSGLRQAVELARQMILSEPTSQDGWIAKVDAAQHIDDALAASARGAEPLYVHRKSGGVYEVIGAARLQTDAPLSDMSSLMVYQGQDGQLWARGAIEFGERFAAQPSHTAQERTDVQQGPTPAVVDVQELKRALMAVKPTVSDFAGYVCIRRESVLDIINQRIASATAVQRDKLRLDWIESNPTAALAAITECPVGCGLADETLPSGAQKLTPLAWNVRVAIDAAIASATPADQQVRR